MPRQPAPPTTFKRQEPGLYATVDARFVIEQASSGWMLTDAQQANELGMPLVRGPFATLAAARAAAEVARGGPAPTSDLAARMAALPPRPEGQAPRSGAGADEPGADEPGTQELGADGRGAEEPSPEPEAPEPPPVLIREWRAADGPPLRRLWDLLDLRSLGDDDAGIAVMAHRNPGLLLVATVGDEFAGSALGGWDGRRGWIYHVGVHPDHQRRGIARQLVAAIEDGLRALGCPKVNVIVLDENQDGIEFWRSLGYVILPARQYGRVL